MGKYEKILHESAMNGDLKAVQEILLERLRYKRDRERNLILRLDIDSANEYGETALYQAVHNGHYLVAKLIVESGADLNKVNKEGETALYWAACSGFLDCLKYLLEKGARVNIANHHGKSPLLWASMLGNADMVKLLLERQANPNQQTNVSNKLF
jgi:ankyrin repeat protein